MRDYQRGQYMSLLIELADAPKTGYLPNDVEGLAVLAGAEHMRRAFSQAWREGGIVRACFKTQITDGVEWIYNERLLEVIEKQLKKLKGGRPCNETPLFSFDSDFVLSIYKDYPRKSNRRQSVEEIARAIERWTEHGSVEWVDRNGNPQKTELNSYPEAAKFIHEATVEFNQSPACLAIDDKTGRSLCPHPSTWYHNDRFLDDRSVWWMEKRSGAFVGMR